MKRRHGRAAFVTAVVMLAGAAVTPPAGAQQWYDVIVGGRHYGGAVAAEFMRYYPGSLTIHSGDTLHFVSEGFHSVTLLPVGAGPDEWRAVNASTRSDAWAYYIEDSDDGAAAVKVNGSVLRASNAECGSAELPCTFDGTVGPLNSGVVNETLNFFVQITAPPGSVVYAISLLHPEMDMRIEVVADGEPASDPADIVDRAAAQLARDVDSSISLHKRFSARRTKHKDRATGRVIWDAWAGVDSGAVSLYGMYPKTLRISRGQRVRWHFDTLDNEVHNAVVPYGAAQDILNNTFQVLCDPDGDAGPGPDNPPDFGAPPYCQIPEQLEVDLDEREPHARGNGVFTGVGDLENSGIRGSDNLAGRDPYGEAPWDVRFTKRGRVRYFCTVHGPIMTGAVVVR